MHPTILQQLAEAHVADLHQQADQRRITRTARRERTLAQGSARIPRGQAVLDRLRSLLTGRGAASAGSPPAELNPEPAAELAQTAAGGQP